MLKIKQGNTHTEVGRGTDGGKEKLTDGQDKKKENLIESRRGRRI
jgi:hypothetical protein